VVRVDSVKAEDGMPAQAHFDDPSRAVRRLPP